MSCEEGMEIGIGACFEEDDEFIMAINLSYVTSLLFHEKCRHEPRLYSRHALLIQLQH